MSNGDLVKDPGADLALRHRVAIASVTSVGSFSGVAAIVKCCLNRCLVPEYRHEYGHGYLWKSHSRGLHQGTLEQSPDLSSSQLSIQVQNCECVRVSGQF